MKDTTAAEVYVLKPIINLCYEAGHFVAIESIGDVSVDVEVGHCSASPLAVLSSNGGLCLFRWSLQYVLLFVGCKLSAKFINSLGCCRCTIGSCKRLLFASRSSWHGRPEKTHQPLCTVCWKMQFGKGGKEITRNVKETKSESFPGKKAHNKGVGWGCQISKAKMRRFFR